MPEFRSLGDRSRRPPTAAELVRQAELSAAGAADVYVEPEGASQGFWENIVQATSHLLTSDAPPWGGWGPEMRWANGWTDLQYAPSSAYVQLVRTGAVEFRTGESITVVAATRLSAVEHLLDQLDGDTAAELEELVNDRAKVHRVGVRIEDRRFVPLTSEHAHVEFVQPTLLLLSESRFTPVDELYRKAFDRALSDDQSGAVTAATSAVEEMFRIMLGVEGLTMEPLAGRARDRGLIPAAVYQFAVKLGALRDASDSHTPGTDDHDVAMLAIHLSGSVLLYLGRKG